jgi:hypothetical protein
MHKAGVSPRLPFIVQARPSSMARVTAWSNVTPLRNIHDTMADKKDAMVNKKESSNSKPPAGDRNKTKAALKAFEFVKDGNGKPKIPRKPSATVTSDDVNKPVDETDTRSNAGSQAGTASEADDLLPLNIEQQLPEDDVGMHSPLDVDRLRAQRNDNHMAADFERFRAFQ